MVAFSADNCAQEAINGPPERGYTIMRDALNATGRPILFSACEWAVDFPATWMGSVANSWRCARPHRDQQRSERSLLVVESSDTGAPVWAGLLSKHICLSPHVFRRAS